MKRRQLFEFEDFSWFPDTIRQDMTSLLRIVHRFLQTDVLLAPLLARAMQAGKTNAIVDLCSGAGGPMPAVIQRLRREHNKDAHVTLTDLYPNAAAMTRINAQNDEAVRYHQTSVDAGHVPPNLAGVRTMVASFHHMPPVVARQILTDAFAQRQPFCLFEISDNTQPLIISLLAVLPNILMSLILTPFARPMTWRQLFFTYIVPVIPLAYAWDGAASNMRTYTDADLHELLVGLDAPDYKWEVGALRKPGYPSAMLYVLGLPV